jgi:hypothetical protein
MIIDSSIPSPIQYVDPTYQPSLFVAANIYDMSGVVPILVTRLALELIDNGVYWGKHSFIAGKTYLIQKLVYTDSLYDTVDQAYAQGIDEVQCVDYAAKISSLQNAMVPWDNLIGIVDDC